MSKKITQDYFDSIIKENIDEFLMEPDDALNDAIKQLESQNTDLSMILKLNLNDQEAFFNDLKKLNELITSNMNESDDEIVKLLNKIEKQLDKDISYRCYASLKINFMDLFDEIFVNNPRETLQSSFLQTFNSYLSQQSDILDSKHLKSLINLVESTKNESVLGNLLQCVSTSCILCESNRQYYIENGLCEILISDLLKSNKFSEFVLNKICILLRNLLLDDDIRVEFGKSHEHAKYIVSKLDGLVVLLNIGLSNTNLTAETLGNIMLTLSKLAVRNEYCQEIYDKGGLKFVMKCLMEDHDLTLVKSSLNLLKSICNNDIVKQEAVKMDAVRIVVNIMSKYASNPIVCELCASTLGTILLRNQDACERLVYHDGDLVLMQVLSIHLNKPKVTKACCMTIRNLVSRNKSLGEKLLTLNIEEVLRKILNQSDKYCYEEAKAALRDLDLKVELKELWTGSGRQLAQ